MTTITRGFALRLATVVIAKWGNAFRNDEWEREEAELEAVIGEPAIVTP